ncbi:hypothetical protein TYRP_018423, partial [Tyrophagus putrescentiae]
DEPEKLESVSRKKFPATNVSLLLAGLTLGSWISGTAEARDLRLLALALACPVVEISSNAHFFSFGHLFILKKCPGA